MATRTEELTREQLLARIATLEMALVEERAARKWEAAWSSGPCWEQTASADDRARYRTHARRELVAERLLPAPGAGEV